MEFKYSLPQPAKADLVALSREEAEKLLLNNLSATENPIEALWQLARFYSQTQQHEKALDYLRKVIALKSDPEHKAFCVLAMGQMMEQMGDYESAARYYREAFALEPVNTYTWYFINNNLGFSLNTLGNFEEGERYCRAAIGIDSQRPNAFKNLGIALRGQGRLNEAAQCFVRATQVDASDSRSLKLLEELLAQEPHLDFETELECCRGAVRVAAEQRAASRPVVHRGLRKHLILMKARLGQWVRGYARRVARQ